MDLMHPPFAIGTGRQSRALKGHAGILQKWLSYVQLLQPGRRGQSLILIARPDIAKTVPSDRMVQIKAAKAPSLLMSLASQLRLREMTKTTHRLVHRLRASAGFTIARTPREDSDTAELAGDPDHPRVEEIAMAGRSVAGDRYSAPLAASYHLRKWLIAV
jgi:hypothetical protein